MKGFVKNAEGRFIWRSEISGMRARARGLLSLFALLSAWGMFCTCAAELVMERSDHLQNALDRAVQETVSAFSDKNLRTNELAVTLLDLREASHVTAASHRGDVRIYPASVIKLFYLVAAHQWMEDGKIAETPELRRALHDMIVDSY